MDEDELASRHHPVEEDMRMQQRVWRFERVGWYALVLVVLLGLAGLFGNGPLSDAQVMSEDGRVHVEYQRLSRSGTTDNLRITVRGTAGEPVMLLLGGPCYAKPASKRCSQSRKCRVPMAGRFCSSSAPAKRVSPPFT